MRSAILAMALLSLPLTSPKAARAQSSSETAAARTLFRQGLQEARDGEWEKAREHFERSYAIAPRATTLLNLAGAQVQTGRLVAGAESYRHFLADDENRRTARYREQAEAALAAVQVRIAHLVIHVRGLEDDDVVTVDGEEVGHAALGVDLPLDPGTRTVVVRRSGAESAHEEVMLSEGEQREVTLVPTDPEPQRVPAPDAALRADTAPATEGDDSALWIGLGIAAGVVLLAGAAVATGFAVDSANAPYSGNFAPGAIQFE